MSLANQLDRAEKAPRRFTDVEVILDGSVVDQLEALEREQAVTAGELEDVEANLAEELELLEADRRNSDPRPAKARKAAEAKTAELQARLDDLTKQIEALHEQMAADLVTFRFTALAPGEWDEITMHSFPRDGVAEDAGRTYNMEEVCKIAAKRSGVLVTGDTTEPISGEDWDRIWKLLRGSMKVEVKSTIWVLNEFHWDQAREAAMVAARKVSAAKAATQSQHSPSASESHPAA